MQTLVCETAQNADRSATMRLSRYSNNFGVYTFDKYDALGNLVEWSHNGESGSRSYRAWYDAAGQINAVVWGGGSTDRVYEYSYDGHGNITEERMCP